MSLPAASEIHSENYRFLQDYIHRASGIVIESDKHYLLEARLLPLAKQRDLKTIDDLCRLLRATGGLDLRRQVVEAMTTHETYFFRDPGQYEALRNRVAPELLEARRKVKRLSIWSAAASSGQESYSLAMMLREMRLEGWTISILATDLSEQILSKAREARYTQMEVNRGLPAAYLVKYFTRDAFEWRLKDEIRNMITFRTFDLRDSMAALGPFDIVLCRNVLIYFDQDTKKRILEQIRGTMHRDAALFLGGAETTLGLSDRFQRIQDGAVYYKAR